MESRVTTRLSNSIVYGILPLNIAGSQFIAGLRVAAHLDRNPPLRISI
jgi:hypothetical protein